MILSKAYDVEILPNFFSITIIDINDYLKIFNDACTIEIKKGKEKRKPIPLIQKYTVEEIKLKLATVKKEKYYITPTDDSQLLPMLGSLNNMRPHIEDNIPIRTDMFGYNSSRYDRLMIAALLMFANQCNTTAELITRLYETSKKIIYLQDDSEMAKKDFFINNLSKYALPYNDIDIMTIFALNKVGSGIDSKGNKIYFGKSLKQTSINLQWYELLEHELPPISRKDIKFYEKNAKYNGMNIEQVNNLVDKWDRYIIDEWIPPMMHYNENDVFIVCEMIRLFIDEVRLRYNISKVYEVNVLSSSRSNIADKLFTKFYSEFSGLKYEQWGRKKTERTILSFNRVILPNIKFKTKELQELLEEIKQVSTYSVGKKALKEVAHKYPHLKYLKTNNDTGWFEVVINNLTYTIAMGGLHTQDRPRVLNSKIIKVDVPSTGEQSGEAMTSDDIWDSITDDSYIYTHWDIASFYPSLIVNYNIAPAHLNKGVFCRLIKWLRDTRVVAKHTEGDIDGIPSNILAEVLKIVINSIYGKLGFEYGDLCDRLAVINVTINGQLLIMMLCEELELNRIEVISANTDGIVVKLYKKDRDKFNEIADRWKAITKFEADAEEYECYINRDINNYVIKEIGGKVTYKGVLNPTMYLDNLQKGYDMPIVSKAVADYFLYNKPIMESLYECKNILDFCKTQNVGRQFNVEFIGEEGAQQIQRNVRFYVSNKGGSVFKVNNITGAKGNLCAGNKVTILNTLDDERIEYRNICYSYYYKECLKIVDPIKLSISPNQKADNRKGIASGKNVIKKYSGMYNRLFEDNEE